MNVSGIFLDFLNTTVLSEAYPFGSTQYIWNGAKLAPAPTKLEEWSITVEATRGKF